MVKNRKKLSALSRQNIFIAVIILIIVGIILGECISVLNIRLQTQVAEAATVYDIIETRALVIRDEKSVEYIIEKAIPDSADCEKVHTCG